MIEPGDTCAEGGVRVLWGIDDDGDGQLSEEEVDGSAVHCDPSAMPPPMFLSRRDPQEPGGSCPYGGDAVHGGADLDRDGILDDDEIVTTEYVCDDAQLVARSRVDRVTIGERCPYGGTVVHSGVDLDRDGSLDDEEITESAWFCSEAVESPEVEVSTGYNFACARKANGTVWCWGDNGRGQLGMFRSFSPELPVPVAGLPAAVQVSAGEYHACALDGDGGVWCWGDNDAGELGDREPEGPVRLVRGIPPMRTVHAFLSATCGLTVEGDVWCWGSNYFGLAGRPPGNEPYPMSFPPTRIDGISRATDLHGFAHACARDEDGAVWCWGANGLAQIAVPASETLPVTRIEGIPRAMSVAAGEANTCVVDEGGEVTCWGSNNYRQLGDEDPDPRPRAIGGLDRAVTVAIGAFASCARRADGSVACWGSNTYGTFGDGSPARRSGEPAAAEGITAAEQLAMTYVHACVIQAGRVLCWGYNRSGETGRVVTAAPTQVLNDARQVSAGGAATCAVRRDGSPWCWGALTISAYLDDTWWTRPTRLADWRDVVDVGAGTNHACFARADGSLWCLGDNGLWQLGDGTDLSRTVLGPALLDRVIAVEAGGDYSCAIRDDKSLWCWGTLGFISMNPISTPLPTELLPGVREVAVSSEHACALDRDGDVHCWGQNREGQIGDGTFSRRQRPVRVLGGAVHVSVSDTDSCALLADGDRWCWGQWFDRRPVRVDAPGSNARMARGRLGDCLLDEGGRLRCLGQMVGDGTTEYRASYVRSSVQGVTQVSFQYLHTCVVDDLDRVWCWGENTWAQIGDGSPASVVRRPVEVEL